MASMSETIAKSCGGLSDTTHTVFETNAKPGSYGYKPHSKYSNIMIEKEVQEFNKFKDANSFVKKYKQPLPSWWPMMPDGTIVTHLYRLSDEQNGSDIQHPLGIHPAIDHKILENEPVDFRDIELKKHALIQLSVVHDGLGPYLTTSLDLEAVLGFGRRRNEGKAGADNHYVRLDLLAMWEDGLFKEGSFADISNANNFANFFAAFEPSGIARDWVVEQNIDYDRCLHCSCESRLLLLVIRGNCWVDYAVLITEGDEVKFDQVGGGQNTRFGGALLKKYMATPQGARSHTFLADPPPPPAVSSSLDLDVLSSFDGRKKERSSGSFREYVRIDLNRLWKDGCRYGEEDQVE